MAARLEADAGERGPVVYRLNSFEESSGIVFLDGGSSCPREVIIDGGGKTVGLERQGALLVVGPGVDITLENITLRGIGGNTSPLVDVSGGGTVRLGKGGKITGNENTIALPGGGAAAVSYGSFYMTGGEITDNSARDGGGVYVSYGGSFYMSGGEIKGNKALYSNSGGRGGGLYVFSGGEVSLTGGRIAYNSANQGGGVVFDGTGSFEIAGLAEILNNTAHDGGGVAVGLGGSATVTMSGGSSIRDNVGQTVGGGVYLNENVIFNMSGGSIAKNRVLNEAQVTSYSYGEGVALENTATLTMGGPAVVTADNTVGKRDPMAGMYIINIMENLTANPAANIRLSASYPGQPLMGNTQGTSFNIYNYQRFWINGYEMMISVSGYVQWN
jgi:hypothetical protein